MREALRSGELGNLLLRRFSICCIAAVALVASACAKKPNGEAPPGNSAGPAATVTVAHPLLGRVVDWDDYIGRFEAVDTVQLRARVAGFVQEVHFHDGQMVKKGQLLFTIDPRAYRAAYDQARGDETRARAALALARADLARAEILLASDAISKEDFDTKRAAVQQNEGALATAVAAARSRALDLSFTRVVAPISGRASDRRVDPGNSVNGGPTGGDVLTTIVTLDPIRFTFEGSEALYLKYTRLNREGLRPSSRNAANPVDIRLQDETAYRWKGRMEFVDNAIDTGSGTIRGKAVVDNPQAFLAPGMFGHMRLLGSGVYDALMVPDSAVSSDQARKLVNLVRTDGTVEARAVELGPLHDGLRIVRKGLGPTDRVVIAGGGTLPPGAKVKVREGRIDPPAPGSSPQPTQLATPAPATTATSPGG